VRLPGSEGACFAVPPKPWCQGIDDQGHHEGRAQGRGGVTEDHPDQRRAETNVGRAEQRDMDAE